jgi:hypothetical protein
VGGGLCEFCLFCRKIARFAKWNLLSLQVWLIVRMWKEIRYPKGGMLRRNGKERILPEPQRRNRIWLGRIEAVSRKDYDSHCSPRIRHAVGSLRNRVLVSPEV